MRPLTAEELLHIWDGTTGMPLLEKTLHLLSKCCNMSRESVCKFSIGERDARLLQLRELMFGSQMKNMATCVYCNGTVEWQSDCRNLYLQPITESAEVQTFFLHQKEITIQYRLPNSDDVIECIKEANNAGTKKMLAQCIVSINAGEQHEYDVDTLPATVWQELDEAMSAKDPQADIAMNIICPYCSKNSEVVFDIMSFLWAEINKWAKNVMQEVALLARNFNWSEKDILNMSARRRSVYIEMLHT